MALDLTTPAEALSEAATLFSGLSVGAPSLPTFPELPAIDINVDTTIPANLAEEVVEPKIENLTEGAVSGSGIFDKIMSSLSAHINSQYHAGILGKSEVAAVYIAAIQATLPQAVNFLLMGQQAYWQTKLLQIQAQNAYLDRARLNVEIAAAQMMAHRAQAEAYTAQVNAGTAQAQYANGKLQLVATMQEINSQEMQEALAEANYHEAYTRTHNTLPDGSAPGGHTARDLELKAEQIALAEKQQALVDAQIDVQRAQTRDTNTDSTPVAGVIGAQKALYAQQVESYQHDAKNKGVQLVANLWTSAKALDDSVASPGPLAGNLMMAMNSYLNEIGLPNAMVNADTPATGAPSSDSDWNTPGKQ